jgi:hypothetical protein
LGSSRLEVVQELRRMFEMDDNDPIDWYTEEENATLHDASIKA